MHEKNVKGEGCIQLSRITLIKRDESHDVRDSKDKLLLLKNTMPI